MKCHCIPDVFDNTADMNGRTGLMWAAAKGEAALIQVMCRHGADPNFKVSTWAFAGGQGGLVDLLDFRKWKFLAKYIKIYKNCYKFANFVEVGYPLFWLEDLFEPL